MGVAGNPGMDMNRKDKADKEFIDTLARLMQEHQLGEIEVSRVTGEFEESTVRLVSRHQATAIANLPPAEAVVGEPDENRDFEDPAQHPGVVPSPMVGTVYLQAEPGAESFVRIGQEVSKGDTLVIVEAMKTMNFIGSPRDGTVRRILVEDGSPVEFGTPIMIVD